MINVITCTNNRPVAVNLLARWLQRQSINFRWIIATDGDASELPSWADIIEVKPVPGMHSMLSNLRAGLLAADGPVVVCEDDEWYSRTWLETCREALGRVDLFGCAPSHYFHVGLNTYRNLHNVGFCALAATAFNAPVAPLVLELISRGDPFLDRPLWDTWGGSREILANKIQPFHNISFKGLPGSGGIGGSHRGEIVGGEDYDHHRLRFSLPPSDAAVYEELINEQSRLWKAALRNQRT